MTTARAFVASLIEQAYTNRKTVTREDGSQILSYLSSAIAETPIGRVVCFVDHTRCNPGSRSFQKHSAARFDLNGKRIARAALIAQLEGLTGLE